MNANFTPSTPSIASSAMLVELGISSWTARKRDKSATADLLNQNHADKSAGAFNKNLLGDCEQLVAVTKFAQNCRTMHHASTLPWSDSGMRLLPTAKYFDYHAAMTKMQAEFNRLVEVFLQQYDWEVAQVHAKLGNLFNRDEYPTVDAIRDKFGFRLNYIPVPEVGDWRVDLGNEAQRAVQEQYAKFYEQQTHRAIGDVHRRLMEQMERLVRQLGTDEDGRKGKVFESTIDSVREMASLLEVSNFIDDPAIQMASQKLQQALAGVCREDIVKNDVFREDTRKAVQAAIDALPSLGGWDE